MCDCNLDYRCGNHDGNEEMYAFLTELGSIPVHTITLDERADRVYGDKPYKYEDADYQ